VGALPPQASLVPPGIRLRPDPSLTTLDGGRVLLGGSPYRLLRLGPPGVRQVAAWWCGDPVPSAPAARALARKLLSAGLANPDPPPGSGPGSGPGPGDVTVVIPVRDRPAELARCLAGCTGLQVIVVDDGSADPGAAPSAAAAAGARCIRLPVSLGPGAARNAGLAAAATPFAAFVDSDCIPLPGWLDPLLRHFTDPLVAAAGPRIVAAGPATPDRWLPGYEHARSALDMGATPSIVRPGARVPYLPAAALVVRRAAAGQGFAAGLPVGEDVDFVWRLAEAGWHVRYEPGASVAHAHRVRLGAWFARRKDYGTSAAPLELRHPGRVPAVSMSGWSALAWLAVAVGQPAAGASVMAATTALLARKLAPAISGPWPVALKLAGGGNLMAGRLLGSAISRTWWPLAVPAAVVFRRTRLPLAAMVLAAPILDWRERRPPMDPARYVAARLMDDAAYSLGVWQGCLRHRTVRPLLPRLWWRSGNSEPGGPG
jgi:mycofactocin system glycosyltransferase